MREADADKRAEKPERPRKVGGGTAEGTGVERQTRTARGEHAGDKPSMLMEEVLRRENVMAAYARVVSNRGAPGVDGVTVDDLMSHCRKHWARIRAELLGGCYVPQPPMVGYAERIISAVLGRVDHL